MMRRAWSERVLLPRGGELPAPGWFSLLELLRFSLFAPVYVFAWLLYVARILWLGSRKLPALRGRRPARAAGVAGGAIVNDFFMGVTPWDPWRPPVRILQDIRAWLAAIAGPAPSADRLVLIRFICLARFYGPERVRAWGGLDYWLPFACQWLPAEGGA